MMMQKMVGSIVALAMVTGFALSTTSPAFAGTARTTGLEAKVSASELPKLTSAATLASPELLMCDGFDPVDPWGKVLPANGNPFDPFLEPELWALYEYLWALLHGNNN